MTNFVDTYLKSHDKAALESLGNFVTNMMEVQQGRAAQTQIGENGTPDYVPAIPACGDPSYFYTCVRAIFPVPAFGDIELCSVDEGIKVCGTWA